MTPALKKLSRTFYLPPDTEKYETETETAHQQLREHLSKEDRILVLSIMDNQVLAWDAKVKRAFVCGFHLALLGIDFHCWLGVLSELHSPFGRGKFRLCGTIRALP